MEGSQSAFPIVANLAMDPRVEQAGLTKRELFAAMILQGLVSDSENIHAMAKHAGNFAVEEMAKAAVRHADILLAALAKEQT